MNTEYIHNEFRKIKDILLNDKKLLFKALLIIVLIAAAVFIRISNKNDSGVVLESNADSGEQVESYSDIYVDISGEVNKPGIYKLQYNTRLYQLIDKAGGLTDDADIDSINQAESVSDGQKIVIPKVINGSDNSDVTEKESGKTNGLININSADKETLMELPGVGEAIAQRIIEYRNGTRFDSKEDLNNVKGIGDKTYMKMENLITT